MNGRRAATLTEPGLQTDWHFFSTRWVERLLHEKFTAAGPVCPAMWLIAENAQFAAKFSICPVISAKPAGKAARPLDVHRLSINSEQIYHRN
jgi:hypothetical protein